MALFCRYHREQLVRATSDLSARVQRLETEHAALRARLEGDRQLQVLTADRRRSPGRTCDRRVNRAIR